jgi:hypothetical protein
MGLSAAQMAQMSALLDEALELDEAGRRQWLPSAVNISGQDPTMTGLAVQR